MAIGTRIRRFLTDEQGAITVDWVVLCSALVVAAAVTLNGFHNATGDHATRVSDAMIQRGVVTY